MKYICQKPGKKSISVIKRDLKVVSSCVTREYDFVFKRAKGMNVWDVDGRKYLDFAAGISVANIGHTNPVIEKALHKQIRDGIHCGFSDFYAETPVDFIETLLSFVPKNLNNAFLSNSGTESVECAYKVARWHTNKKWVIAFKNAFHGRSMGSLSMTNSRKVQRDRFQPFLPIKHTIYPDIYRMGDDASHSSLDRLEKTIKVTRGDCAAVFMEPVQGEGGYIVPPKEFVKGVRKLCDQYGILLCIDEVQSGCYRTGKFLAIENFGVEADVVSLSKSIGGGVPLGVTLANKKTMDWPYGSHGSTFGGNLLACAAGIASLKFMKQKKLGENVKKIGNHIMKRLNEMKYDHEIIGDVRGLGLMIGIEIVKDKKSKKYGIEERKQILCKAAEKGLIILPAGKSTIRICPPLIITKKDADHGLDIIEDSIKCVV